MARALSAGEIAREVGEAMEETLRLEYYPERLLPYTPAELNFLKDFVATAMARVLERIDGPSGS